MKKFEIQPIINSQNIGEVEVSVELTDEEINKVKSMSKEDFAVFIKPKATVRITDFDVDYDAESFNEWVESENVDDMGTNIKKLKLKLSIAENALNGILMLDDYDNAPEIANSAIEKLASIDGF